MLTVSIYVHPDAATAREQDTTTTEGLGGVDNLGLADEASFTEEYGLRGLVRDTRSLRDLERLFDVHPPRLIRGTRPDGPSRDGS